MSVAASEGQLVVRLSTPRRVDYYAQEPDQEYTLIGALRASGQNTSLPLRVVRIRMLRGASRLATG